jgi:hypothetical protein
MAEQFGPLLVRSMSVGVVIIFLVLSACASPPVQMTGPAANRLSDTDVQEIRLLISKLPSIEHRIRVLFAVYSDKVRVVTGAAKDKAYFGNRFTVIKRAGKWIVDKTAPDEATVERTITVN